MDWGDPWFAAPVQKKREYIIIITIIIIITKEAENPIFYMWPSLTSINTFLALVLFLFVCLFVFFFTKRKSIWHQNHVFPIFVYQVKGYVKYVYISATEMYISTCFVSHNNLCSSQDKKEKAVDFWWWNGMKIGRKFSLADLIPRKYHVHNYTASYPG